MRRGGMSTAVGGRAGEGSVSEVVLAVPGVTSCSVLDHMRLNILRRPLEEFCRARRPLEKRAHAEKSYGLIRKVYGAVKAGTRRTL
jgi:hypothetical protein